ncbi:hypothetical protein TraAM80_07168 [Trypanosoma rangeli]|uniref:HIT-type domain-containing protein n=1 Tax=Trypanosoma rangeli TaxID=5698 RepID=A0A422N6T6_TRYRA|nr:uncharacterized protein TraAM80_07168 [Trypanosoma rangeli]RNF01169.1 hypothetical protein TraAM80_07168 [Trypanosoma rangeli]|eukprot:RNF01169.1 hypothetical protein TraAM80_07168 [Trypanosoma rangeli]
MYGNTEEYTDTASDDSYRKDMQSVSSAADADLDWIPGEDEHEESHVDPEDYDGGEEEGEEMPQFVASAFSNVLVSDLANHQLQEEMMGPEPLHTAGHTGDDGTVARTKVCCICSDAAMYTCPGCGVRTCSLTCVRVHKKDSQCGGERDVAKKVPLSAFTDGQLQRDFHFLEDVRRTISNCRRGFSKVWHYTFRALPPPLHALREAAKKRGVVCQITSEGMKKRDANTSRFDRRTETIMWRCQFNFHGPDFTISTDWGNERQRLGDIVAYCWSTNPPLPCFHINRQYNRASKWIGAVKHNEAEDEKCDEKEVRNAEEEGKEKSMHEEQGEDDDKVETKVKAIATCDRVFLDNQPQCQEEWSPCQLSIAPLSSKEAWNEEAVRAFMAMGPAIILSRAERLGMQRKFFRMSPSSTLNEALRTLFFINEFPVFDVIQASALEAYPLVTEADKELIRESFRAAPRPPKPERKPRRTKADLSPEEAARYSKVPCRMFLAGCCKLVEEECPYWHCEYREIPACRNFVKFALCEKGDRCSFRHDLAAVGAARKRAREERQHPCEQRSRYHRCENTLARDGAEGRGN